MQDPCLTFITKAANAHRDWRQALLPELLRALLRAAAACAALWGCCVAGTAMAAPAPAATALPDQVARWLASHIKMPVDRITVQAPDPRWQQPQCPTGLRFDTPFSNANTVRVRCDSPQWQVFLRAQWPEEAAPPVPAPQPLPAVARAEASAPARPTAEPRRALVLTRAMSRGSLLSPASVEPTQVPAREADSLLISDAQFLEQMEAVRDLPAGVPLRQTDIRPAVLVRQGQLVTMTVGQGTGFTITVRLEALQDGRMGERVMLRNSESGRTVSGVVTGMNAAKGA